MRDRSASRSAVPAGARMKSSTPDGEEEPLKEAFRAMDTDGNGFITAEDLRDLLESEGATSEDVREMIGDDAGEKEVEEMVREADVDGDGHINYEEFVRMLLRADGVPLDPRCWRQWELSTGRVAPWGRLTQVPPDEDSSMDVWPFYLPPGARL